MHRVESSLLSKGMTSGDWDEIVEYVGIKVDLVVEGVTVIVPATVVEYIVGNRDVVACSDSEEHVGSSPLQRA